MQTVLAVTILVVVQTASDALVFPSLRLQEAYAHIDPSGCAFPVFSGGLAAFRGGTIIPPTGFLVDGETIEYIARLFDVPADGCAVDDGTITIISPDGDSEDVNDSNGGTPAPLVPCIGGEDDTDDNIGPEDCGTGEAGPIFTDFDGPVNDGTLDEFRSEPKTYVVNCEADDGGNGSPLGDDAIRALLVYDGLVHDDADDAPPGVLNFGTQLDRSCLVASTLFTKSVTPSEGDAPLDVTFTYEETNDGDVALTDVNVSDPDTPSCGPFDATHPDRQADSPGDNDDLLEPGETWVWTCEVTFDDAGTFTNVAFATVTICVEDDGDDCTEAADLVITGDPECETEVDRICDLEEQDDARVVVRGAGTIIIKKDVVPGTDPQDFSFTHNITSNPAVGSPFKLDDDPSPNPTNTKTFFEVPAGSYRVTEMTVPSIPLLSIICIDPTGDSGRSGNSADIELDAGETVTCTFINGIQEAPCENGELSEPQPEDAISMTTVRNQNIVKTIHAEKQIFDCELSPDGIPVIADVTIFVEIYEDLNTKTVISKQVEVVTCIKRSEVIQVLECNLSIPSTDRIPVTNCTESPVEHPQEMNTVRKGATAKTIEAQKEVFTCIFNDSDPANDKKVDLVLFTEIFQNLNTLTSQDPQILSVKCVIKIDNVTVESCRFTNHPL
jgi:hypothetical protein